MKEQSENPNKSVRNLEKSAPHRTVGGLSVQYLNDFAIEYESYNERHTIMLLSLCHDIHRVISQPSVINYIDEDGRTRKHIPDFEVTLSDGSSIFLEVKAIENLLLAKNISKYVRIAKEYHRQKLSLRFLTNIQIEAKPLFGAVKLLFGYINCTDFPKHVGLAKDILNNGAMPMIAFMEKSKLELRDVYSLIAKRHITFDLSVPLSKDTCISLQNKPYGGISLESVFCSTRYGSLLQKLALGHKPTDQSLLAAAKNWRQSDNHPDVWGVVGGFTKLPSLRNAGSSGFLRDPKRRRAFAPGHFSSQTAF